MIQDIERVHWCSRAEQSEYLIRWPYDMENKWCEGAKFLEVAYRPKAMCDVG
jgi:hypothetical protein